MNEQQLKQAVNLYWDRASCGTEVSKKEKFSQHYFNDIEAYRYSVESEIFAFAQFTRFHGKKVLEVGVGAGTDFVQWVRAGAHAYGIDLTQEAIDNTLHRLALEGLRPYDLQVADAEKIPYPDNSFDCVYSWGVIHHSPDTLQCLHEIVRVTKSTGTIKIMIYNRYSLFALYRYILCGLFKGRLISLKKILYYHQESLGTKAYTFKEVKKILSVLPVKIVSIKATVSQHDLLFYKSRIFKWAAYLAACLGGWNKVGWFMTIELEKK